MGVAGQIRAVKIIPAVNRQAGIGQAAVCFHRPIAAGRDTFAVFAVIFGFGFANGVIGRADFMADDIRVLLAGGK